MLTRIPTLLEQLVDRVWPVLAQLTIGATAILAIAALVVLALRKSSASVRHRTWTLAIVSLLVLPMLSPFLPRVSLGWISVHQTRDVALENPSDSYSQPTSSDPDPPGNYISSSDLLPNDEHVALSVQSPSQNVILDSTEETHVSAIAVIADRQQTPQTVSEDEEAGIAAVSYWPALLVAIWLMGAGLSFVAFFVSLLRAKWLLHEAVPLGDSHWRRTSSEIAGRLGLQRLIKLLGSPQITVPLTVGWLRPRIGLPSECLDWSEERRRIVLAHELAHIARRDVLWQSVARLARAIYWFHPLVWLASRRMRFEREVACDDAVLLLGERPSRYATQLLEVASTMSGRPLPMSAAVAMASPSTVEQRIRSILHPALRRGPVGRRMGGLLASGALVVLLLAGSLSPTTSQPQVSAAQNDEKAAAAVADDAAKPREPKVLVKGVVVDTKGTPASGATVRIPTVMKQQSTAKTDAQGRFRFHVHPKELVSQALIGESADGTKMAYHQFGYGIDVSKPLPSSRLVLRPTRRIEMKVVDKQKNPVANARVGAVAVLFQIDAGRSDAQGKITLRVPENCSLSNIYSYKAGVGLDYISYSKRGVLSGIVPTVQNTKKPEKSLTLTLDGSRTVQVKLVGPEDQPLEGIPVFPWYFQKPGQAHDLNVSGFHEMRRKTNSQGIASFDWIPAWNEKKITFWTRTNEFFAPQRPMFDPKTKDNVLTVRMVRRVPVRGTVRHANGRPAANILVKAAGAGYQTDSFREQVRTDAKGAFQFLVYPNQLYLFAVNNTKWAAKAKMGIIVRPDTPVDGVNFNLKPATKVHGRVTIGEEKKPLVGQYISLYHYGADLHSMPGKPQLPNPSKSRLYIRPTIVQRTKTDERGRYVFYVGPGQYDVRGPASKKIEKFSVTNEPERTFNFHTPRLDRGMISGLVVIKRKKGKSLGVAGAKVRGISKSSRGHVDLQATADQKGRFRVERWLDDMTVHARSSDGKLAGIVDISGDDKNVAISVAPVASARGRLIDAATGRPIAGKKIYYRIRIKVENKLISEFKDRFGGSVTTDAEGRFQLTGLVVGSKYYINVPIDKDSMKSVGTVTAQRPEVVDLGDLEFESP